MNIVVANSVGRLDNGDLVVEFPSRWSSAVAHKVDGRFDFYPYELGLTTAMLKRDLPPNWANVTMVDGCHECLSAEQYIERLAALDPAILITECSALTYPAMTRVMQALHARGMVMAGRFIAGPYGMYNPIQAMKDGWTVLRGEYEYQVADIFTLPHPQGEYVDLDWLPFPEDNDVSRVDYEEPFGNPYPGMVQVYASRGCPLACKFCVVPMYYGGHGNSHKSHRVRNVDSVCDELQYLSDKYSGRFNGAYFHEETHNANPEWLTRLCNRMIERGLNQYHYDAMCGYWPFTEPVIKLMSQAGYCNIRIGIESLSDGVGKRIGKVVFEEKLIKVLEWCKAYGIRTYGTLQVGAQGATEKGDLETLDAVVSLRNRGLLDIWQHSISTPQPGTPFYDEVKQAGYLITEDVSRFNGVQAVVSWPGYTAERINAVRRAYCNV